MQFLDEKGTVYKYLNTAENNNNGRFSLIGPPKGRRLDHYMSKNCFTNQNITHARDHRTVNITWEKAKPYL